MDEGDSPTHGRAPAETCRSLARPAHTWRGQSAARPRYKPRARGDSRRLLLTPPWPPHLNARWRGKGNKAHLVFTGDTEARGKAHTWSSRGLLGAVERDEHGRAAGAAVHGGAQRGNDPPRHHPRRYLRVPCHRHLRLRRRGLRPLPREDVPRHELRGRPGGRSAGARAGPRRGSCRFREHLGRAREPGHHVRRARGWAHLPHPRGLLLGGADPGRHRGHAPPAARHGRDAPAGVRARLGRRGLARGAARGRNDLRAHVRLLRHRDRPEARARGHHRAAGDRVPAWRQRAGRRAVRRRRDEPGEGVRARARRLEVEAPLGVLARPVHRGRARWAGLRVPRHPVRRRRAARAPAARAGGLLAIESLACRFSEPSLRKFCSSCCYAWRYICMCRRNMCFACNKGLLLVALWPQS